MRVSEAMRREVRVCKPQHSIRECAKAMADMDVGVLPVVENNMLVGMVTDRDISVRAVAAGKGPDTPVRNVLSKEVLFCFDDQDLEHVAKRMGLARVRRVEDCEEVWLPVTAAPPSKHSCSSLTRRQR